MPRARKEHKEIQNYYELIPKDLKKKYHNPNYSEHGIEIPFRMLVVGASGSGKTNVLLELIHKMNNTFEKIVICCKSKDEPLYEYLESKIPRPYLQIYEDGEIPDIHSFDKDGQVLIAFDDLVLEKDQRKIQEYFIRGRKIGGGISSVYLSQSYFKTPKTIRLQCNYILLKKLSSKKDLTLILSDFSFGVDLKTLTRLYNTATGSDKLSFLLIDVNALNGNNFRKNFRELFQP